MSIPPNLIPYVNPKTGTIALNNTDGFVVPTLDRDARIEGIIQDSSRSIEERRDMVNTYINGQGGNIDQRDLMRRLQAATPQAVTEQTVDAPVVPSIVEETVEPVTGDEIVVTGYRDYPDHRVRLSAMRGQEKIVYGMPDRVGNILTPLHATNGLIFPYTPTVQVSQDTSWQTGDLEHANYDILSFQKASSATFSITGKFTVQNQREGEYLLAALHYLRTVSKAYFGAQDVEQFVAPQTDANTDQTVEMTRSEGKAGLPPPVLLFSGYGNMMFNEIHVVVKSHSWAFEENQDMIKIDLANGGQVWLPPMMTLSISLMMQQNTNTVRSEFKLDDFRTGKLLNNQKGWF